MSVGLTAVTLLGAVLVGVGSAGAAPQRPALPASAHARSAVGDYDFWVTGDSTAQDLELNGPGGFTLEVGFPEDEGTWAAQGTSVAMFTVTNFDDDTIPVNCVLVGTIGKHGLNSETSPGSSSCGVEWWATRTKKDGPIRAGARSGRKTVTPVGVYNEFSSNGGTGTLTVDSDNTFTTSYQDAGNWASLNKAFAFGVATSVDGDKGCMYLGTLNAKGINSKSKQGPTQCQNTEDTWYAKRVPKQ